ncbi:MAG: hypothetical protein V9F82_07485 [Dermatophilaceae bacterium]
MTLFTFVIEQLAHGHGGLVEKRLRAQQGQFVILRFAAVGHENGRDAKRFAFAHLHDKGRAAGIPNGVAARFKGAAHAAGRERRAVGLLLHQSRACKFFDHPAVVGQGEKGVVFFGSFAGERLEPVRKVGAAFFLRPFFHAFGHHVGYLAGQFLAALDGGFYTSDRRSRAGIFSSLRR